jgi:hypothetical protein
MLSVKCSQENSLPKDTEKFQTKPMKKRTERIGNISEKYIAFIRPIFATVHEAILGVIALQASQHAVCKNKLGAVAIVSPKNISSSPFPYHTV